MNDLGFAHWHLDRSDAAQHGIAPDTLRFAACAGERQPLVRLMP